jgi:hypothetical protein
MRSQNVEELAASLDKALRVSDFTSSHLTYAAWRKAPSADLTSARLKKERIATEMANNLVIDVPEIKPNLLMITMSIFLRQLNSKNAPKTSNELMQSLNEFDIILPRNPLLKIMSESRDENWEIYCCKPSSSWPLFIDRTKSYTTNPGQIGALFELAMTTTVDKYHKVYAVTRGNLGGIRLALTGEIDCIDSSGKPVEVKSRPAWAPFDNSRSLDSWIQSTLAGICTIVTGSFTSAQRNGPVTFNSRKIKVFGT